MLEQFSNFSLEQMNINFSIMGFELNSNIYTQTRAIILISHGKLMLREIMFPNFMNCTILNIHSSIIHLPFLHHMTIFLNNLRWKTVTPLKLASANPVVSLTIHPIKSTCEQMGNHPYKDVKVNARKGK
jgi:hypothetical protein